MKTSFLFACALVFNSIVVSTRADDTNLAIGFATADFATTEGGHGHKDREKASGIHARE